jgi:hypothetical protein
MKLLFTLLMFVVLPQMIISQEYNTFKKGTSPKSIKVKKIFPENSQIGNCDFMEQYYFNEHSSSTYKNGYDSYKYEYATQTYSEEKSGVYTYIYDDKNNWIDLKLEKETGEIEIIIRYIKY